MEKNVVAKVEQIRMNQIFCYCFIMFVLSLIKKKKIIEIQN